MIITHKALPRRTFLRGVGAVLALTVLDAMVPALSAASESVPTMAGSARMSSLKMAASASCAMPRQ